MNSIEKIFNENKCLIIAEVAQAHDGSLGMAHSFIDAVARTNANAIKFQTHIAEAESTIQEPWRIKFSYQDELRFDYWKRMEFTAEQWAGLKKHADEKGLIFLSSPFSIEAVELLEKINIEAWKIASGEITNYPMIEKIIETKLPMLISSGMSDMEELDKLVSKIKEKNIELAILQCTSSYPTPAEKVGLNILEFFRERYKCRVGLSDHSGKIFPGLAGAAIGMDVLELHVTFSKEMFGPDVIASVTIDELKQLTEGIRFIEKMNQNPVIKNDIAESMKPLRDLFTKSIVAQDDLSEGTIIKKEHLAYKKPGVGIPATEYKSLLGRILKKDIPRNHFFSEMDFK